MKIYFCHSKHFDYENELYKPLREIALNHEHEIFLPHEPGLETVKSKDIIRDCNIVFAEVSFAATGMGIELGWADAFDVPIICFYKSGTKPSNSLRFIAKDIIEYSDTSDLLQKVRSLLESN